MAANGGAAAPSPSALLPRRVEWTRKRSAPDEAAPCAISLLQFNVLADGLSGRSPTLGDFTRPPAAVMDWAYRGPLLVEEMLRHEADVITAQEVDHFSDYFVPRLARAGYSGMFHKKPDSPCRSVCELEDGCALWYKRSNFLRFPPLFPCFRSVSSAFPLLFRHFDARFLRAGRGSSSWAMSPSSTWTGQRRTRWF